MMQPNRAVVRIEDAHKKGMSISPEKVNISIAKIIVVIIVENNALSTENI